MIAVWPHIWIGIELLLLPGLAITALIGGPIALLLHRVSPVSFREGTVLLIGLCFCGYIVGVIAGNSESPIAQTVLTGTTGVITGLVAYVHIKETAKASGLRTLASLGLIALLLTMLLGLITGGAYKRRFEPYRQATERYNAYFKQFAIPLCLEERKLLLAGKQPQTAISACPSVEQGIKSSQ